MVTRIKLLLPQDEYLALLKLALSELCNPSDEVRHILQQEFGRLGLLLRDSPPDPAARPAERAVSSAAPAVAIIQVLALQFNQTVNQNGGVNINAGGNVEIGGDVAGRDKTEVKKADK